MSEIKKGSAHRDAAMKALESFPIDAVLVEPVSVAENITFRVTDSEQRQFALRLHRPGYNTLAEMQSERTWVAALHAAGFHVQSALNAKGSESFVSVELSSLQQTRLAGMTEWLSGELLVHYLEDANLTQAEAADRRTDAFRDMGALAASMHNQTASWPLPQGFTRPRLDSNGLLGNSPRWGRFWEHLALDAGTATYLESLLQPLRDRLQQYGAAPEQFGLIHADLHPGNLLICDQGMGVLDFDDAAFGWHMYDLATALVEYRLADDADELRSAMIDGYRQQRAVGEQDLAMLPVFELLRQLALIGWLHERPEHWGSDYLDEVLDGALSDAKALGL